MIYRLDEAQCRNLEFSKSREWLLTNGIGGFAMGTAAGMNTRRYHGHLVAAVDPPGGRMVLVAGIDAFVQAGGTPQGISTNEYPGAVYPDGYLFLSEFSVGTQAVWKYRVGTMRVEKRLTLHPSENTCTVEYLNSGSVPFLLTLRPLVSHKPYHQNFRSDEAYPRSMLFEQDRTVIEDEGARLQLLHAGALRTPVQGWYYRFEHVRESDRGLDSRDDLFCPCELRFELPPGAMAKFIATSELEADPKPVPVVTEPEEKGRLTPRLADAANAYLVTSRQRTSILAGYPWFTDWGRDTMISLPGLCLCTGKIDLARSILRDYSSQMRHGLIPNRFVESGEPETNTVDATLWFANAVYKTLRADWDEEFAQVMLPALDEMFQAHVDGTLHGIYADPDDGLLKQGGPGLQLTWMDAKIGDWVVTPRTGKAVEISSLWINALRILEWLGSRLGQARPMVTAMAERAESAFESAFWDGEKGHYRDVADPDDSTLRPNQVIAMSLPMFKPDAVHARSALSVVASELLTPVGLRTLGPNEPGYRPHFRGSMRDLDSAYHQGTVWPWLLGPYVTALVHYTGDRKEGKRILKNAKEMLGEYGLGGIAEVYDGDEPRQPAGCPWQAWSTAEILRAWTEDIGGD